MARYAVGYGLWCYLIILLSQVVLVSMMPDPGDPNVDWKVAFVSAGMAYWVMMLFGMILVPSLLLVSLFWKKGGNELRIAAALAALIILLLFRTETGGRVLSQVWWPI